MLFPSRQTVKIKWLDELAYLTSFAFWINLNKAELNKKWGFSPVSFQGWQVLFSVTVFLCLLSHKRIRSEVKIIDRTSLVLLMPIAISNAVSVAAGANALSVLPVPIFLVWTNLCPAVVTFFSRKPIVYINSIPLGCIAVCATVLTLVFMDPAEAGRQYYLFLFVHLISVIFQSFYVKMVNLQLPELTKIFYNNVVSFITLFPVSIYHVLEINLNFSYLYPTFICGFLYLALQIFSFNVKTKNTKFIFVHGMAQVISIILSFYIFQDKFDIWVWCLIGINWFITSFLLGLYDDKKNESSQFILVIPNVSKNFYVEKYINYGDMA